jgi:hypothetical protein
MCPASSLAALPASLFAPVACSAAQAAAEASQQQLRDDWNKQRRALQAIVHG